MFSQNRTSGTKTRLMHQCSRDGDCPCNELIIFYLSLLHLTGDIDNIGLKLNAIQINEPEKRLPFKAFLAWVQLEMYLGRLSEAETLINDYIRSSSHLADPKTPQPLMMQQDSKKDKNDDSFELESPD